MPIADASMTSGCSMAVFSSSTDENPLATGFDDVLGAVGQRQVAVR
jgi:hypothetical protein